MKKRFEEKGLKVLAEIDRPIVVCTKDNNYFLGAVSKDKLIICNFSIERNTDIIGRFEDLQDDLKNFDTNS